MSASRSPLQTTPWAWYSLSDTNTAGVHNLDDHALPDRRPRGPGDAVALAAVLVGPVAREAEAEAGVDDDGLEAGARIARTATCGPVTAVGRLGAKIGRASCRERVLVTV